MRKFLSLLVVLAISISLCACTNSGAKDSSNALHADSESTEAATPEPQSTETVVEQGIHGDNVTVGNYRFNIPEGFNASTVDNSSAIFLVSDNIDCTIQLASTDISNVEETALGKLFDDVKNNVLIGDDVTILDKSVTESTLSGKTIEVRTYVEQDADLNLYVCSDAVFTDSWYVYIIKIRMNSPNDNIEKYAKQFALFTGLAEYLGKEPRFDAIQYTEE